LRCKVVGLVSEIEVVLMGQKSWEHGHFIPEVPARFSWNDDRLPADDGFGPWKSPSAESLSPFGEQQVRQTGGRRPKNESK
jgi:hypothetical protein